jgi:hypothetical protein
MASSPYSGEGYTGGGQFNREEFMSYELVARCTDEQTWLHRARLESLYEADKEIKGETLFRHVSMRDASATLGYAYGRWARSVRLLKDWHVRFYRSTWRGVPCYHLEWSGIDHIFVEGRRYNAMTDDHFFE